MLVVHVTTAPMALVFLRGQVGFMKERGIDVVAISSPGPELEEFGRKHGVAVHAVKMPRRITPLADLFALMRLCLLLRELRPDIVHAHTPKGGLLGTLAAALAGVPVRIYHMRGLPFVTATGLRRQLLRWTERVSCFAAHHVLCVSRSLRDVALAERLCGAARIEVLAGGSGNGVDASGRFDPARLAPDQRVRTRERLGIPEDAYVIGFVGRVVRDKGVVELLEAFRRLAARHDRVRLLVVGGEEDGDPVPADTLRELRADARIHWLGFDWDTPPLYAAMDCVALPTYREGFPNVPLEAAAMELPVVATRIPGCVDAVEDGVTGVLVPPRDASALELALERYLLDPELRRRHGQAGRRRVLSQFAQEVLWKALLERYLDLAGRARVTRPAHAL